LLSEDERKQRRRLGQARAKVKHFESMMDRAERRAAFWRRRVADIQFEQKSIVQPPLWPVFESDIAGELHVETKAAILPAPGQDAAHSE